jgi:hypothetical protein
MEAEVEQYQPKKLINILAEMLQGHEIPFIKTCTAAGCNILVTKITNKWSCSLPTGRCMLCREFQHNCFNVFFKCPDCRIFICGYCTSNLGLGGGRLRYNVELMNIAQTVYSVNDATAIGTLICIDNMLASDIYTFKCSINGFPNEELFVEPLECYIIVELFADY